MLVGGEPEYLQVRRFSRKYLQLELQVADKLIQDEYEWGPMCKDRARNGYNSGMGEIFRKVAGISPIQVGGQSRVAAIEASTRPVVA